MFIALTLIAMFTTYVSFSVLFLIMFDIMIGKEDTEQFKKRTDGDIQVIRQKMKK